MEYKNKYKAYDLTHSYAQYIVVYRDIFHFSLFIFEQLSIHLIIL